MRAAEYIRGTGSTPSEECAREVELRYLEPWRPGTPDPPIGLILLVCWLMRITFPAACDPNAYHSVGLNTSPPACLKNINDTNDLFLPIVAPLAGP